MRTALSLHHIRSGYDFWPHVLASRGNRQIVGGEFDNHIHAVCA